MKTLFAVFAASAAMVAATPSDAAPLVGTSVSGSITLNTPYVNVSQQFTSPATVGSSVEFTGKLHAPLYDEDFTITSDFSDTNLIVRITSSDPNSNLFGVPIFTLNFTSPSGSFPVIANQSHSCDSSAGTLCEFNDTPATFTGNNSSINAGFTSVYAGDVYTINFAPAAAVPEVASWAMMILGMGAVGFAMRRRQSVRVSYAA